MLRPTVVKVTALPEYRLELVFDNKETRIFDVSPFIKGSWFGELKDPAYFSRVKPNGYSLEWEHGQDLCPDDLYYGSNPI